MLPSPRAARYSGSDRPAWRMNHTGTLSTGWHRQARRNAESATGTEATLPDGTERGIIPSSAGDLSRVARRRRVRPRGPVGRPRPDGMIDGSLRSGAERRGGEGAAVATHPELEAEQAHVDRAYERLDQLRSDTEELIRSVIDQGRGGTHQFREERDVIVRTSLARLDQLDIGEQALCFGRIDRREDGRLCTGVGQDLESFHIGRLGVSGEDLEPLVVDWRAPVAEPFYRATGREPMGLVLRRHLAAQGRRIVGVEDERFARLPGR